jgi:hypothetical protein
MEYTDEDDNAATWVITAGDPNAVFTIGTFTGEVNVSLSMLDFETTPVYNITMQVTDMPASQTITAESAPLSGSNKLTVIRV